jgi:hypothetical protein
VDFKNFPISSCPTTLYHDYPVSISMYYYVNVNGGCSGYETCTKSYANCYNFGFNATNDCGTPWNYEIDTGCGVYGTGTMVSGASGEVTYSFNPGDTMGFSITAPYIRASFSSIPKLIYSTTPVIILNTVYSN